MYPDEDACSSLAARRTPEVVTAANKRFVKPKMAAVFRVFGARYRTDRQVARRPCAAEFVRIECNGPAYPSIYVRTRRGINVRFDPSGLTIGNAIVPNDKFPVFDTRTRPSTVVHDARKPVRFRETPPTPRRYIIYARARYS